MSSIGTNSEDLVLNADGSSSEIKLKIDGTEKASIDQDGNLVLSGTLTSVGIDDNANATAITIDSSENVLVGQTTSNFSAKGIRMRGDVGQITATRDGAAPLALNRLTSDGSALDFNKAGTGVGSIGVTASGAWISLGGTAAANQLDDYEEGTFTPYFLNVTVTDYEYQIGWYTKIGNKVFVQIDIESDTIDNADTSAVAVNGLPFTNLDHTTPFTIAAAKGINHDEVQALVWTEQTYLLLFYFTASTGDNDNLIHYSNSGSNIRLRIQGHYEVA